MGAWGPGLYQDDVACDIKGEYIDRLGIGQSNIEATQELLYNYEEFIEDMEDGPVFWFALADTQWKYGRLFPEVRDEAIRHIHAGIDLERWQENKSQYKKRKEVLLKLEERLNSLQPPEKKVAKLIITKATWEVGDVLLYKIREGDVKDRKWCNKYILLRVLGITKSNIGSLPREYSDEQNVIGIYNWVGDEIPDIEKIKDLKFIIEKNTYGRLEEAMCIFSFNRKELKELNFEVIMKDKNYEKPSKRITDGLGIGWWSIHNTNYCFTLTLSRAEKEGTLVDETAK